MKTNSEGMTEKIAREIVGNIEEKYVCNRNRFDYAKGYLGAAEKTKCMVEVLERTIENANENGHNDVVYEIHMIHIEVMKNALAKWEKEK